MASANEPTGILLFNLGGPDNLDAVEPFLINLFSDPEIIPLPFGPRIQPIFARLIATLRGPSVRRNYALIGGGSPQLRITRAQAAALEARVNGAPEHSTAAGPVQLTGAANGRPRSDPAVTPFRVFVAMRYSRPSADEALAEIEAAGVRRIVTVPLFPHWSRATTGSWQREFHRTLASPRWRGCGFDITAIDCYPADPGYLDAFADTVRRALDGFPSEVRARVVILFSAHGLPKKVVDAGDPYVDQIEATRRGLLTRLGVENRQLLGYQSRTGPVQWIGPGTEELIERLGAEGTKALLVVPLSFVSDHIETLYEVDILFAQVARRAGITDYRRPEALNTHPLFIQALAGLVERHVGHGIVAAMGAGSETRP